jgi:hypothetical protein
MKSEPESTSPQVQTITINGQQYQIVSPAAEAIQVRSQSYDCELQRQRCT